MSKRSGAGPTAEIPNTAGILSEKANGSTDDLASTDEERRREQHLTLKRLLASWRAGDAEEQRETWAFLKKALDEDRPSYRKLFP